MTSFQNLLLLLTVVELIPYQYSQGSVKESVGAVPLGTPGSCAPRYLNEGELWSKTAGTWLEEGAIFECGQKEKVADCVQLGAEERWGRGEMCLRKGQLAGSEGGLHCGGCTHLPHRLCTAEATACGP